MSKKYRKVLLLLFFSLVALTFLFPLAVKKNTIVFPTDLLLTNKPWYFPRQTLIKNPYMQDSITQLFPWKHLVFESFQQHMIPFWNPYQGMGVPFMASMKPMVFYPLNLLYLLGEVNAWNALLLSQLFLSMLFMYLLSREFKLGVFPSVLTSFAFAFSSLMVGVLEFGSEGHVLLWLPLLVLLAKKYADKQKGMNLFFLGLIVTTSIFAGQLQYTGYELLLLVGFVLFYCRSLKVDYSSYFFLLGSIFLGIGVGSIQLIPGFEMFASSLRGLEHSREIFSRGLIEPYQLFRLFAPDFFGNPVSRDATIAYIETSGYFGIIPLFFSFYAMIACRKNMLVRFFSVTFFIAMLLSVKGVGEIPYLLKIPLLSSAEADRIFSLVLFSGAILSGFGFSQFLKKEGSKKIIIILFTFTLVFAAGVGIKAGTIFHSKEAMVTFLDEIRYPLVIFIVFFTASFVYILQKKKTVILYVVFSIFVVGLTFLDLFKMGYHFLTFSDRKFLYPQSPLITFIQKNTQKTLDRTFGLTEPEIGTYLNIYSLEVYNPLYLKRSGEVLNALQGKLNAPLPVNKYILTGENKELKQTIDFLGVSWIVTYQYDDPALIYFKDRTMKDNFTQIYHDNQYAAYKNKSAYPRFGLYYDFQTFKDDKSILKILSDQTINLRKTLLMEEKPPVTLTSGQGSAKLLGSTVNTQTFLVNTDKPAFFYISDTYFPGWRATVNNKEVKIYRANYNFRAILVPKGKSILKFSYIPDGFMLGITMSILSLILLSVISLLNNLERRKTLAVRLGHRLFRR